jgi:mono/diheme cytochrome c family protein
MTRRTRSVRITTMCALALGVVTTAAVADAHVVKASRVTQELALEGRVAGSRAVPSTGPHAGSHGGTVIVDAHGVLVAERNAGALVRSDRDGRPLATLELSEGLGQIVTGTGGHVFVADRRADRVLRVQAPDASTLRIAGEVAIGEPYGLALSPDGETLYVTSVADHELVAIDATSLAVKWRAALAPEPRGVAVSGDGSEATVGFLSSGALAVVDLRAAGESVAWRSLDPRDHVEIEETEDEWGEGMVEVAQVREARSRFEVPGNTGQRRARNVFAVAYVGHGLVVAPHQLSTPQMKRIPSSQMQDSYGGGPEAVPAIVHRLAVVDDPGGERSRVAFASLATHQPRALAYDVTNDTLYVAGYGDDRLAAIADVSQPAPYLSWTAALTRNDGGKDSCGPDGIAIDGEHVWVHCELTRRLFRVAPEALQLDDKPWKKETRGVALGPELAASKRSAEVEHGAEIFRRGGDPGISDLGVMACASCHAEGRQDGLSWRLGKSILQTPMLAGRVVGTAPYKWDGGDPDLAASFEHTIERLGGSEWSKLSKKELAALEAYVLSLPAPRTPSERDADSVARGRTLFFGALDCGTCHAGDRFTDGAQHPFDSRGLETTDTPSLVGLAHTAPYYHDGSARDLHALLTDKGSVHDMADVSGLKPAEIADLTAYLRTL